MEELLRCSLEALNLLGLRFWFRRGLVIPSASPGLNLSFDSSSVETENESVAALEETISSFQKKVSVFLGHLQGLHEEGKKLLHEDRPILRHDFSIYWQANPSEGIFERAETKARWSKLKRRS